MRPRSGSLTAVIEIFPLSALRRALVRDGGQRLSWVRPFAFRYFRRQCLMHTSYSVVQAAFEWASTQALCCSRHILQSLACSARGESMALIPNRININMAANVFMTISPYSLSRLPPHAVALAADWPTPCPASDTT